MSTQNITRLYLVEKLLWHGWGGTYIRSEVAEPVRAFLDPDRAEKYCKQHEDAIWKKLNPFCYGSRLAEWTSLDAGRLRDWMLDIGLEPPAGKFNGEKWKEWFDKVRPTLTELQQLKVREAMDRIRFYRVVELTE